MSFYSHSLLPPSLFFSLLPSFLHPLPSFLTDSYLTQADLELMVLSMPPSGEFARMHHHAILCHRVLIAQGRPCCHRKGHCTGRHQQSPTSARGYSVRNGFPVSLQESLLYVLKGLKCEPYVLETPEVLRPKHPRNDSPSAEK